MAVINKGISKAVKEAFINGTHTPEEMLVKLAYLNTDEYRKHYLVNLTKELREKYGMDVARNKGYGRRKKTGAKTKPTTFVEKSKETVHPNGASSPARPTLVQIHTALKDAGLLNQRRYGQVVVTESPIEMRTNLHRLLELKSDLSNMADQTYDDARRQRISDEDRIVEEYVKLDDAYKELQTSYDDMADKNSELKREIARLQVIVTYLEGRK
jgi:hypothetical protein